MAGACGCSDRCNCVLQGINGVTVSGAGDPFDPYLIGPPPETPFAAVNSDGAVSIIPAGPYGHEPAIDLVIDPASTIPYSFSASGLRLDCCAPVGTGGDIPTGGIIDFAGAVAPTGYLLADGASHPTASFLNLFGVIGYTYGGAGANFNVPDYQGRTGVGLGTHVDVDTLGETEGFAVANRTSRHLHDFAHTHGVTASGSNTNVPLTQGPNIAGVRKEPETGPATAQVSLNTHAHNIALGAITVAVSGATAGAFPDSLTDERLIPYIVTNKIIKT